MKPYERLRRLRLQVLRPDLSFMAYEPNPDTYHQLTRSVAVNGLGTRVQVFNEPFSGSAGALRMWCGRSSLESSVRPPADASGGEWRTVHDVSLSTVVEPAGRVALLKIDAERAEADILKDAQALHLVDAVVGEHHERQLPGTAGRVMSALVNAGFRPRLRTSRRCGEMFVATRT